MDLVPSCRHWAPGRAAGSQPSLSVNKQRAPQRPPAQTHHTQIISQTSATHTAYVTHYIPHTHTHTSHTTHITHHNHTHMRRTPHAPARRLRPRRQRHEQGKTETERRRTDEKRDKTRKTYSMFTRKTYSMFLP